MINRTLATILGCLSEKQGELLSRTDIEAATGLSKQTLIKYLGEIATSGRVRILNEGVATRYKLVEPSSKMKEFYYVYVNGECVGFLGFTKGKYQFAYANECLLSDFAEPISSTMPLDVGMWQSASVFPAFESMLPEGVDKKILARKSGTPTEFYQFEHLSNDALDVTFSRTRMEYPKKLIAQKSYLVAKDEILEESGTFPEVLPYAVDIEHDVLFPPEILTGELMKKIDIMSLSGYQHKLKIHIDKKSRTIVQGSGEDAAVYFMKPYNLKKADPADSHYFPHLAVNEHLFMSFAKDQLGFDVPYSALCKGKEDGEFHYIVKYFNRLGGYRYAMDEVSTLMGLDSETKYKTTAERMFDAIASVLPSHAERLTMLSYFFYSYVIKHEDMHTKNLSIINDRGKHFAAPLYDIAATGFYDNAYGFESHLPVNGKQNNIRLGDFMGIAKRIGLKPSAVKGAFSEIIARYAREFPSYISRLRSLGSMPYYPKKVRPRDGEPVGVLCEKVEFADVIEKNYKERIEQLVSLGYFKQLGLKAYARRASLQEIDGMVNEAKIIEKLELYAGGISAECFEYLKHHRFVDAIDRFGAEIRGSEMVDSFVDWRDATKEKEAPTISPKW